MNDDKRYQLHLGDCLEVMRTMEDNSCDSIVCDPPYALSFMGKAFDTFHEDGVSDNVAFQKAMTPIFKEALRVAKPGAHLLAFGGTRTYHRLACAIEDAGWEVRDCLMWVTGQSMPKGLNVGKAIEKSQPSENAISEEAALAAKKWEGWNSQLKPAFEPIVLARKPLEGTIVENVLKYGTGAINIDACRVPTDKPITIHSPARKTLLDSGHKDLGTWQETKGRYPANLLHDGSPEVLACFPDVGKSSGGGLHTKGKGDNQQGVAYGKFANGEGPDKVGFGDSGSAARFFNCLRDGEESAERRYTEKGNTNFAMKPGMRRPPTSPARFFYCAKASRSERNKGCERLLTWEQDQELTQLIEKSSQLIKDISESTMLLLEGIVCNMSSYGKDSTDQFLLECKSTISMAIRLITELKTSNSYQLSNTSEPILDVIRMSEESGISIVQLAERLSRLKQDSISAETVTVINAVNALFSVLSEIRSLAKQGNIHCTIKPLALMRWCVTLVAPPDSVVLDPFMGSGSTGIAALQCGCRFVGIEREPEYMAIAERRIATALDELPQTAADASRGGDAPPSPSPAPDSPDSGDSSPHPLTLQQEELAL